jgi:hypothetical protein
VVGFLRFGGRARHKANARQSACWPLGRHCSELGGAVLLSGFAAVFEAVAFAVHLSSAVISLTSLNSVIIYMAVALHFVHWHKPLSVFQNLMQIGE